MAASTLQGSRQQPLMIGSSTAMVMLMQQWLIQHSSIQAMAQQRLEGSVAVSKVGLAHNTPKKR